MTSEETEPPGDLTRHLPDDWDDASVERLDGDLYLVRRPTEDGTLPPFFIPGGRRPILVDVHYGRSAIVRDRVDAVRYGYHESDVYTEFYYLQLIDEPEWVQITEESEEHDMAIVANLEQWVEEGRLTEAEAEWADDQFD
ncbi:hypothetical protein [Salinigranum salinum]|uniref:hypothetical protein n=1 Tax=Salinigranum salinum TaxID=1364937 RepID=UPI0012610EA3|nr:hypothetical protein [Salinigranum salinum]